jgi:hypothetical protein
MERSYFNESHKKQVKLAMEGQSSQPKMSHAKAAEQYNKIMKSSPTAVDPTQNPKYKNSFSGLGNP